jgi:membrane protease YdiL (CAAX protease family)
MNIAGQEALIFVLYFLAYVAYLAWRPEGEFLHWITLVAIPLVIIRLVRKTKGLESTWRGALRTAGLEKGPSRPGIAAALVVGVSLSCLQLAGRNGAIIKELIRSGRALWLWPLSFLLMVMTAAGTEEFFFRGVLQKRLTVALRSRLLAIGIAAVFFALFHVPYAYHNVSWGTQHNLWGAVRAAAETGLPLGVLLGSVFAIAGDSLAASVLAHALINSLPGMVFVQKLFDP